MAVVPSELITAFAEGEGVLFVGADILASAGFPSRTMVMETLLDGLANENIGDPDWAAMRQTEDVLDTELLADLLAARLDPVDLVDLVGRALQRPLEPDGPDGPAITRALAAIPATGFVTNDWTGYFANAVSHKRSAVRVTPWSDQELEGLLRSRTPFVVEAYGGVDWGRLILSADDYHSVTADHPDYAIFVGSLLSSRTMLFVSTSIEEVQAFLSTTPARRYERRDHWALVPWRPDFDLHAERLRYRFGVQLIPYSSDDAETQILSFARRLTAGRPQLGPGRAPELPRVTSLSMSNIGPFDQIHIDFATDRAILIGDNACGKTTVLRAIALALAGATPESERLAEGMLNAKSSTGRIVLGLGRDEYTIDLRRERHRVRLSVDQFTPAQAGLWLSLGFPALRGVSTSDPRGPVTAGDLEPGPDDVLPLLSRSPDRRMDGLKQWVINAEMRSDAGGSRERSMLGDFFEIVRALMPGVDFTYAGVDRATWEIRLESAAGTVNFDLLSRGMVSVLGWIGVLLQRLYEVYPDADRPTHEPALVLIDEIDVHLHPEWQRSMLPLVAKHFPGVQLMATTHSPLVLANAKDDAVIHLRRVAGRLEPQYLPQPFTGMGPDEILTSPAFELDTPLDLATESLINEYTTLLAHGRTPENDPRAAELADALGELPAERTPQTERIAKLFTEWLLERLEADPPEQRTRMLGEAQRYLNHLLADD